MVPCKQLGLQAVAVLQELQKTAGLNVEGIL
jgi:hypothetical protein